MYDYHAYFIQNKKLNRFYKLYILKNNLIKKAHTSSVVVNLGISTSRYQFKAADYKNISFNYNKIC